MSAETGRMAYFINELQKNEKGYIPCIAKEGEKGFYLTDYNWGPDLAKAEKHAQDMNERMGVSKEEAFKIVVSTMTEARGRQRKESAMER